MSKQEQPSAVEKFKKHINAIFSQYHSEQMSKTVKRGMLHRATNGYAVTRPPLGYSITTTPGLFEINREGLILRKILKNLTKSKTGITNVFLVLTLTKTAAKVLSAAKLKRLLSDPYYVGYISYKGQLFEGLHEPLITENEQKKLLVLLKKHNNNNSLKSVVKSL